MITYNAPAYTPNREDIPKMAAIFAETIGKPVARVMLNVVKNDDLYFQSSFEPCVLIEVKSVGKLSAEENKKHASHVVPVLSAMFGVESGRILITFMPLLGCNVSIGEGCLGHLDNSG